MKKILKEPSHLLHKKCKPVVNFKESIDIAENLLIFIKQESKWWNRWLGFAANQIGYSKRVIALRSGKEYEILINPKIIKKKFPFPYVETCYSLKNKNYYLIMRYLWVKVQYQDVNGRRREIILRGPSAVYQEIDHLDGIMVSERGLRIL